MDLQQVTFANEAFYLAFEAKDFDAMANLWSQRDDIVCLHPGWPALFGRDSVLDSWRNILGNPQQSQVSCYGARVMPVGEESAAVVCYEETDGNIMIASNVFIAEGGTVRLYLHQSGYCANPPSREPG